VVPLVCGHVALTVVARSGVCVRPRPDGGEIPCINLGSYNYLGFADDWHTSCKDEVLSSLEDLPSAVCAGRLDSGNTELHEELERKVAEFLNKPAAICFNMGYMTNAATIPALMGKGSLIVSDAFNHTSIVNGARASGATIRVFEHNGAWLCAACWACVAVLTPWRLWAWW